MNLMTERNAESNHDTGWQAYGCRNAVPVVSDRERGRGVPDFGIVWDLNKIRNTLLQSGKTCANI